MPVLLFGERGKALISFKLYLFGLIWVVAKVRLIGAWCSLELNAFFWLSLYFSLRYISLCLLNSLLR